MFEIIFPSSGNSGLVNFPFFYHSLWLCLFYSISYFLLFVCLFVLFTGYSLQWAVDFCMHDCFFILLHGKSYSVFRELLCTVLLLQSPFSCTFFIKVFLPFLTSLSIPPFFYQIPCFVILVKIIIFSDDVAYVKELKWVLKTCFFPVWSCSALCCHHLVLLYFLLLCDCKQESLNKWVERWCNG